MLSRGLTKKRALLCICPPYPMVSPPAGAAALLGYLKAHGIADFGFLDLRLGTPPCYEATYSATGVFGESFFASGFKVSPALNTSIRTPANGSPCPDRS